MENKTVKYKCGCQVETNHSIVGDVECTETHYHLCDMHRNLFNQETENNKKCVSCEDFIGRGSEVDNCY